jgi:hypothetical protein
VNPAPKSPFSDFANFILVETMYFIIFSPIYHTDTSPWFQTTEIRSSEFDRNDKASKGSGAGELWENSRGHSTSNYWNGTVVIDLVGSID